MKDYEKKIFTIKKQNIEFLDLYKTQNGTSYSWLINKLIERCAKEYKK